MKTIVCSLLFIATLCYSQVKNINLPDWKTQVHQIDSNKISIRQDLFEFTATKSNEKLSYVEIRLFDGKLKMEANPAAMDTNIKFAVQVIAWPASKFTTYYDMNGDTELDYISKSGYYRKPETTGVNDIEEFIIYHDTIIPIVCGHRMSGPPLHVTALDGHEYDMTPKGWILVK
jgi:hypothetical protein